MGLTAIVIPLNPNKHIWNLITRKLTGQSTLKEERELRSWLDQNPQDRALLDELKSVWEHSKDVDPIPSSHLEKNWELFNENLDSLESKALKFPVSPKASISWKNNLGWLAAACGLSVIILTGAQLFDLLRPSPGNGQSLINVDSVKLFRATSQPMSSSFKLSSDSLEFYTLNDRSRVWLNKNSTLSYDQGFNDNNRRVRLSGEAYFEIKSDSTKPFIIDAGPSEIQVLGTSFNIKAYENQDPELTVLEGKVTFSSSHPHSQKMLLETGEYGRLYKSGGEIIKRKNYDPHFLDWKHAIVYRREISNPANYLTERFEKKKNAINQTEIDGVLQNRGTLATFKNIKLKVRYYHKKKEKFKSYVFTVYQSVGPGESIEYQYRLADWFSQTEQLQIQVVDATVARD